MENYLYLVAIINFLVDYLLILATDRLSGHAHRFQQAALAALLGAMFIGIGAGLCVRAGGATCGDDALAMSLSHRFGVKIQWVYLVSDLLVLGLSLSYIPIRRIGYSLLTVILSGQLVGLFQTKK